MWENSQRSFLQIIDNQNGPATLPARSDFLKKNGFNSMFIICKLITKKNNMELK